MLHFLYVGSHITHMCQLSINQSNPHHPSL